MDEKLLIKKVLKGDVQAFAYFVTTYQDMAVSIAYRMSGSMQDAEDIVQDAFVKAFHNLHAFRVDSKFSTWFYRIVYNTAVTSMKGAFLNAEFVNLAELENQYSSDWSAIDRIENSQRKEVLASALNDLPKDEGLLLTLFYMEDNSVKEIAQIVALSEANVRVKLHRARKRMAESLTKIISKGEI